MAAAADQAIARLETTFTKKQDHLNILAETIQFVVSANWLLPNYIKCHQARLPQNFFGHEGASYERNAKRIRNPPKRYGRSVNRSSTWSTLSLLFFFLVGGGGGKYVDNVKKIIWSWIDCHVHSINFYCQYWVYNVSVILVHLTIKSTQLYLIFLIFREYSQASNWAIKIDSCIDQNGDLANRLDFIHPSDTSIIFFISIIHHPPLSIHFAERTDTSIIIFTSRLHLYTNYLINPSIIIFTSRLHLCTRIT